jgi:hypothetical protein
MWLPGGLPLDDLVRDLDDLFELPTAPPDIAMARHASEHLVMETQLARWFAETVGMRITPLREAPWWR